MIVNESVLIDDTLTHDASDYNVQDWGFIQVREDSTAFAVLIGSLEMCSGSVSTRTFSKGEYLFGKFQRIKMKAGSVIANTVNPYTA